MNLILVNQWAKLSCPRWNQGGDSDRSLKLHAQSRRFFRKLYRKAAENYWKSGKGRKATEEYKNGKRNLNTYPWPYVDPKFASWPEDDSNGGYNLISDQSNCVVRYATSYVAWKIFEETGTWPQKKSNRRLDAKRWVQFLAEAGYTEIVNPPLKNGHHYVGVDPTAGIYGSVVWFEETIIDFTSGIANISTYRDRKYDFFPVRVDDYAWVKIN